MDLGWLVLVASMSMSMFVCVSSFHEMTQKFREEQARCLLPLRMAIAAIILAF